MIEASGPGADAESQPALVLTGRGGGALGLFASLVIVSVITGSLDLVALLSGLGALLLAAPGLAWWRARQALGPPAVHVRLRARPATVAVGDDCALDVTVSGGAGRRLPPLAIERPAERWHLTHRPPAIPTTGSTPTSASRTRHWWHRRLVAPTPPALLGLPGPGGDPGQLGANRLDAVWTGRRGVLQLPSLRVWAHDPFGLFAVTVAVTAPVRVVVHPRPTLTVTAPHALSAGLSPTAGALVPSHSAAAGWGEFADLRPYVAGDRLNLIDWPALARYDRLLVRRFDPESGAAVRIVLDDRSGVHRRAAFERLLGALLGLVDRAVAEGSPVEVSTLSGHSFPVTPTAEGLASFFALAATFVPQRDVTVSAGWPAGGGALLTTATGAERLSPERTQDLSVVVI